MIVVDLDDSSSIDALVLAGVVDKSHNSLYQTFDCSGTDWDAIKSFTYNVFAARWGSVPDEIAQRIGDSIYRLLEAGKLAAVERGDTWWWIGIPTTDEHRERTARLLAGGAP